MSESWQSVKLKSFCKVLGGYAFKSTDFGQSGVPVLKIKNIGDKDLILNNIDFLPINFFETYKKYKVNNGDILISMTGSHITMPASAVGRVSRSRFNGQLLFNQRVGKILVDESKCNKLFLFYCMTNQSFKEQVGLRSRGAANQANISGTDIEDISVNLPPLPTQQKIAAILSAYDDLIENNNKRIKLLEELAQITYEEWFVRMKFPNHKNTPIDEATGLPVGWENLNNCDMCAVSGGGTPSRDVDDYWVGGTIPWFSPTDLSKAKSLWLLDSSEKINEFGLTKSSAKLMGKNSFMMTSRATIGLFGLFNGTYTTNQGFINILPNKAFYKYYLLFNFKSRIDEFVGNATGTTFLEISKSNFKKLGIIKPTDEVLILFNDYCSRSIDQMMNLTKQNQRLKEARDLLLPRLMSGTIDVDSLTIPMETNP